MKVKFSSLMNSKLVVVGISVLALTSFAAAGSVSYLTTAYGPQTFQADTFLLTGQSGNVSLNTVGITTADINFASFTVGDSGSFNGSEPLTITFDLTLDGVTHTLTQQATWTITPSQDSFITVTASGPVLFVTTDGTWNVTLDPYSIVATSLGTFTQATAADFASVPERGDLATPLFCGILVLGAVFRFRPKQLQA